MWYLLAAVCLVLCAPADTLAHNAPIPIAVWGGFPPAEANCQRVIAESTATCALRAHASSDACLRAKLNGDFCDEAATATAIERAHADAIAAAGRACRTGVDLGALGFASIVDMNIDIDIFCQDLQLATESAIYGPAMSGGAVQPAEPATRACIEATSDASRRLLESAFRLRQRALDVIAHDRFPPSRKFAIIARSTQRIQRFQQRVQERISAECPAFASIYPRTPVPYFTLMAERGDCLAGRVYVQDFVICPDSVCGNGMQEPGERCDDGNTVSGDDCRADCQAVTIP